MSKRDELAEKYVLEIMDKNILTKRTDSYKAGWQSALENAPEVLALVEAAVSFMNLEDDYQAEDTSGLHYAVQYWIEEKARRKAKLSEALNQYRERVKK